MKKILFLILAVLLLAGLVQAEKRKNKRAKATGLEVVIDHNDDGSFGVSCYDRGALSGLKMSSLHFTMDKPISITSEFTSGGHYICDNVDDPATGETVTSKSGCDKCASRHCAGCCRYFAKSTASRTRCCANQCQLTC